MSRSISLWAMALVLLQLGAVLHLAAARHGVCWEHGVVVDLDAAPAHVDDLAPTEAPGVNRASGPAVRLDGHSHCASLWVMRAARTEAPADASGLVDGSVWAPLPPPEAVAVADGRVLRLAPKQSPPI